MSIIAVEVSLSGSQLSISIQNDGKGIPIELHPKEKLYIPELIFGHLLTGSNFDDKEVCEPLNYCIVLYYIVLYCIYIYITRENYAI